MSTTGIQKAYDILKDYCGSNNQIMYYKYMWSKKGTPLEDFAVSYILRNHDYQKREINKIVGISSDFGQYIQEKDNVEFKPEKLLIVSIIGEMNDSYHCYVKYRKSMEPKLMYVNKKYILHQFDSVDYNKVEIDFDKYDKKTEHLNRKIKEHQKEAIKFLLANKKCILADTMGLGKMEPISSLIPTPDGFVRMGDIKIGSKIFGSDGKIYDVEKVFPHKNKEIYRVSFSDGTSCECGLDHLWLVQTRNDRSRGRGWHVKSLKEMIDMGFEYKSYGKTMGHDYKFNIPVCEPVSYRKREHLIHPYLMGMCLGDGSLCGGNVVISIPDFEIESVGNIKSLLNEGYTLYENRSAVCPNYTIVKTEDNISKINEYNREIKRLELNVHGNYKFIPEEYLIDSIENRKELLKGLMDSDGSIQDGNKIGYYTNSEHLANDVAELVYSLGGIAKVHSYNRIKNNKEVTEYHVLIQIKFNPFKLKRKADKYNPTFKKYCVKKIIGAEYVRNEDAQCIMVNSPDHTYLTSKRYIVTHNTTDCVVSALEGGFNKILIITTASLKSTWKRELMLYTDESEISIVNGSEWDGSKRFTIVNYDIMQNFHEVPMEPMYEFVTDFDEYGLPFKKKVPVMVKGKNGEMVQKMKKSNNKEKVFECLSNSPLFNNNFECVIIDEAQKLSNNKSIRYRVVEDFIKRAKPPYVFLVSGTPLTNKPMNLFHILKLIDADVTKNYDYYVQRYCGGKKMRLKTGKTIMLANGATNLNELREKIKHIYIRRLHSDIPGMVNKQRITKYYDLSIQQMSEYDKIWGEYVKAQESIGNENSEEYRQLVEGILVRQYLAKEMTKNTIELADDIIENDEKVVIICTFQEEIELIKNHYKGKAVVYDGKMTAKAKDKAENEFMNNPKIKVFIGQIIACSVGLTLTVSNKMIFNSYSWVAADNLQAEDRIYRITQKNDATCIYQLFTDSISQDMFEKVMTKEMIMNETIKAEKDK